MELAKGRMEEVYRAALAVTEELVAMDPSADSPEGKLLIAFAAALEAYEERVYPITPQSN